MLLRRPRSFPSLRRPTIIFESNHVVIVNKPPGWHSIPNAVSRDVTTDDDKKCLLSYLQSQHHGGGSTKTFLKPTHRLDQPCSGLLMYAKTTKAASRIQSAFAAGNTFRKTYLAIIALSSSSHVLQERQKSSGSIPLRATIYPPRRRRSAIIGSVSSASRRPVPKSYKGWSVRAVVRQEHALHSATDADVVIENIKGRPVELVLQDVLATTTSYAVVRISTHQGARHVVRSVLAAYGMPILGDVRYGRYQQIWTEEEQEWWPDKSVALHAEQIHVSRITSSSAKKLATVLPTTEFLYAEPPVQWLSLFPDWNLQASRPNKSTWNA